MNKKIDIGLYDRTKNYLNAYINKIDFLESHNKNYTKKQYYNILDIQEFFKNELLKLQKNYYKNYKYFKLDEIETFKIFDDLYNIIDKKYKELYKKAKKLYYDYTKRMDFSDQVCFISSSSLNGFYFPNVEDVRCIAFIDSKPILLY